CLPCSLQLHPKPESSRSYPSFPSPHPHRFYLFNELKTLHDERETSQSSFIFIHQIRTGERIKRQKK
uniref:Uncharacterized protein n=1 Tax=Corvus moneduloides TaxID=1196302 RepID=A0A8C3E2D3_CORMO